MISRRHFLKRSAMISLAPTVPAFLSQAARAVSPERDAPVLVVVQLDGGNDGINTVIPYADEAYARHRKELRIPTDQIIKLNDEVGLHPRLKSVSKLVDDGRMAIVQGVGYPNPSRSHFRSMAIWHTARFDEQEHNDLGWIGRSLDRARRAAGGPDVFFIGDRELPLAVRGRRAVSVSIASTDDLKLESSLSPLPAAARQDGSDVAAFVQRSVAEAYVTARDLADSASTGRGGAGSGPPYPSSRLAKRLELISQLIKSGSGARVYYAVQPGYDTHVVQLSEHAQLLGEFSSSVKAFLDDLASAGLADRVMLMAFSEFGRRVAENDSLGTDHGTAGPVFIAGSSVEPGLVGATPSLTDLEDGDLKMSIDFRRVYAALLDKWLEIPAAAALGGQFEPLTLFGKG